MHLLNSVSASVEAVLKPAGLEASQGIYTAEYLKDPTDVQWRDDPAVQEYFEIVENYGENINPADSFVVFGVAAAQTMEHVLSEMQEPTREALMDAVRNIDQLELGLLLPGITINTTPEDGYPIEADQMAQFRGQSFHLVGDVISYEGRTPTEVIPEQ